MLPRTESSRTDLYRAESCRGVLLRTAYFRRTNYNGSNCKEASCPEPSCPGHSGPRPLWQSVYTEPSCRGSICQNVVFQILNTGKNISRKAVHVVILGVTLAYVLCDDV